MRDRRGGHTSSDEPHGELPKVSDRPAVGAIHAGDDPSRLFTKHTEQPMPTPNGWPSIQSLVHADLEQREQVGIERYGTPLQPDNGRDALRDAYEEALDLACYLRQAIAERDMWPQIRIRQQLTPQQLADLETVVNKHLSSGVYRRATIVN